MALLYLLSLIVVFIFWGASISFEIKLILAAIGFLIVEVSLKK